MAKQIADWSNSLSIYWLKKYGYLRNGWRSGGITWTRRASNAESSIGFMVSIGENEGDNITLRYTKTSRDTGEKEDMNYRIELVSTSCNYGGKRYWFICPLYKNGQYCGRRVGVLFSIGKWFGCRHCGDLAYAKQMEGGKLRWNGVSEPELRQVKEEVKRIFYKGKPTRKFRRFLRLNKKFNEGLEVMLAKLEKM